MIGRSVSLGEAKLSDFVAVPIVGNLLGVVRWVLKVGLVAVEQRLGVLRLSDRLARFENEAVFVGITQLLRVFLLPWLGLFSWLLPWFLSWFLNRLLLRLVNRFWFLLRFERIANFSSLTGVHISLQDGTIVLLRKSIYRFWQVWLNWLVFNWLFFAYASGLMKWEFLNFFFVLLNLIQFIELQLWLNDLLLLLFLHRDDAFSINVNIFSSLFPSFLSSFIPPLLPSFFSFFFPLLLF